MDVGVEVDSSELIKIANCPDSDKSKVYVRAKNEFNTFIVLDSLNYRFGKFNISAHGENNSWCDWQLEEPEIQDKSTVEFSIIFKVPKGWEFIDLIGHAWIEPKIDWLNGQLTNIISSLPGYLKNLFGSNEIH